MELIITIKKYNLMTNHRSLVGHARQRKESCCVFDCNYQFHRVFALDSERFRFVFREPGKFFFFK